MMRVLILALMLTGCAYQGDYADQFCTLRTDKGCKAWTIGKIK